MIGNNSCGTHSLLAGKTVDNVEELRDPAVRRHAADGRRHERRASSTPSREGGRRGEIYAGLRAIRDRYADQIRARFPQIPAARLGLQPRRAAARSTASTWRGRWSGTEGTCAVVLEAKVTLIHSPQHRALVGLGYPDAFAAADHVPEILEFHPIGLEGFEGNIIDGLHKKGAPNLDLMPEGRGVLLVEFGFDDPEEAADAASGSSTHEAGRTGAPHDAAVLEERSARDVEDPRIGAARGRGGARRAARVGGLGRFGGRAGEAGRVSPRSSRAAGRIPLSDRVLRAFRPRLHPHARQLRPLHRGRHPQVRRVRRSRGGSRRQLRRIAVRENTATASRAARCCRRCSARS